jgi:hypothetical protein
MTSPLNLALAAHVRALGFRPFVWGETDCCLFVADWVREVTGIDPAAEWRGCYWSLRTARRLCRHHGGIVAAICREMDALFSRTDDPLPGDVGIVRAPVGVRDGRLVQQEVGAIRTGDLWTVKGRTGVGGADFPLVAAWRILPKEAG